MQKSTALLLSREIIFLFSLWNEFQAFRALPPYQAQFAWQAVSAQAANGTSGLKTLLLRSSIRTQVWKIDILSKNVLFRSGRSGNGHSELHSHWKAAHFEEVRFSFFDFLKEIYFQTVWNYHKPIVAGVENEVGKRKGKLISKYIFWENFQFYFHLYFFPLLNGKLY